MNTLHHSRAVSTLKIRVPSAAALGRQCLRHDVSRQNQEPKTLASEAAHDRTFKRWLVSRMFRQILEELHHNPVGDEPAFKSQTDEYTVIFEQAKLCLLS